MGYIGKLVGTMVFIWMNGWIGISISGGWMLDNFSTTQVVVLKANIDI